MSRSMASHSLESTLSSSEERVRVRWMARWLNGEID
jgi:hypothetical protein